MPISSQARRERGVPAHLTESQFERVLANASRLALVGIGVVVLLLSPFVTRLMHLDTLTDDPKDGDDEGGARA